jgi:hypothetical protein
MRGSCGQPCGRTDDIPTNSHAWTLSALAERVRAQGHSERLRPRAMVTLRFGAASLPRDLRPARLIPRVQHA